MTGPNVSKTVLIGLQPAGRGKGGGALIALLYHTLLSETFVIIIVLFFQVLGFVYRKFFSKLR